MIGFIFIVALVLLIGALINGGKPELLSHWSTLLEDFDFSTKDFYELLKKELQSNGVDNIDLKVKELNEGSVLSASRLYLRVKWKGYTYDCCFAPFGNSSFVSWWLFHNLQGTEAFVNKIPFVGAYFGRLFFPKTYYKIDTASMFMTYAQASILKVIDEITRGTGTRKLSDEERKPIMKDIFKR